uniref:FHA domain-containing protein n=1 Tax=Eiseniibacteriota bacterium TaxID=2212470 RepID=A0A832I2S4_UNCEI
MSRALRAARPAAARALALAAACALAAPAAVAASPSTVLVQNLRITGGDRQEAWVTVLDGSGAPVEGLEAAAFSVEHDGRAVSDLSVTPWGRHFRGLRLTLAVDPDLLSGRAGEGVATLLGVLARGAGERDRLALASLGEKGRRLETPLAEATGALERVREWSADGGRAALWDRLYDVVREASRAPRAEGSVVLAVTHAVDAGSGRGPLDALAFAQTPGRPVQVLALVVGGEGGEEGRLAGLAARSGGALARVADAGELAERAETLVARLRGAYRVTYRVPDFDAGAARHVLAVSVEGAAGRRTGQLPYDTADALPDPWWRNPLPWVILAAVLLVAGGAAVALRPRRLCRLIVRGGEEAGCSYEIYGLPVTLGAAVGNDLVFAEARLSRNHAVLERRGSAIELVDLNSENGTFVNGDRITRRRLAHGDRIRLGGTVELTFEGRG